MDNYEYLEIPRILPIKKEESQTKQSTAVDFNILDDEDPSIILLDALMGLLV